MTGVELKVQSFNPLTAEEGRELYSMYVKRGLEIADLRAKLAARERVCEAAKSVHTYGCGDQCELRAALSALREANGDK